MIKINEAIEMYDKKSIKIELENFDSFKYKNLIKKVKRVLTNILRYLLKSSASWKTIDSLRKK